MLRTNQIAVLVGLSLALWILATLYIRFLPDAFVDPFQGNLGFAASVPMAWLSVWLVRRAGRLEAAELVPGVAIVGAVAMMIDGAALRWSPGVYGDDPLAVRLGAAWLLWGYGLSLGLAYLMVARSLRHA
ncbi:hypothetical protein LJR225_003262 [Phenylobacterium sp. LjRoot225]|uniref:hypothetical protein n=1 Tax=Phenylobacterium sp. LjRoot225 TaxID=3342285 RepID=UPI003ED020F4